MARRVVKLPDIGEGTTEAEIVSWLVKIGDRVSEEDPLAEVMTDKATVEIPSPVAGTVVALNGKPGEKLPVGSELVLLETEAAEGNAGRSAPPSPSRRTGRALSRNAGEGLEAPSQKPLSRIAGEGADGRSPAPGEGLPAPAPPSSLTGKPLASPAVRQQAWDLGIELQFVRGSGPGGRITHDDLAAYAAPQTTSAEPPGTARGFARRDGVEDVPVVGLRRAIAEHMELAQRIPHFTYIDEIDVTALEALRAHLNEVRAASGHLTLLPFLMRAIVNAIVDHPQINARYDDAEGMLHRYRAAHIGVATQTPNGLLVPVVRHAEALDLWQTASELGRLAEAARSGKTTREELTGSTITLTSLGPLGGLAATPVINHPEVAIVGVNRIDERPVVRAGQVVIRKMMNLSSSFDHRIVDGWEAASFIARLKVSLEHPATLFID